MEIETSIEEYKNIEGNLLIEDSKTKEALQTKEASQSVEAITDNLEDNDRVSSESLDSENSRFAEQSSDDNDNFISLGQDGESGEGEDGEAGTTTEASQTTDTPTSDLEINDRASFESLDSENSRFAEQSSVDDKNFIRLMQDGKDKISKDREAISKIEWRGK